MSIPTHGDFSCADLLVIQAKAAMIFADDQRSADVQPFSEAAQAVLENQTADFTVLKDPDKDREVSINWIQACDKEVVDCTPQCDVSGVPAGAFCKNYALDICKEVTFSLRRDEPFRHSNLTREEVVARMLAESLKAMDEYIAQLTVAKLDLFAGENAYTSMYTVAGTNTEIPPAAWNSNLNGYFALAMLKNKMRSMYMLTGEQMFLQNWMAEQEQANADGKGNANKMRTFKKYFDVFNIDQVMGDRTTFLVNPSAMAIVSKTRYPSTPMEVRAKNIDQKRYSTDSPSLTSIRYDVVQQAECDSELDDIIDSWKVIFRGGIFQNPLGCTQTRTGILKFQCAA